MARLTPLRLLAAGLVAAALVAVWAVLGPAQLGGPVTYAITDGTSMEPGIHAGDLVIARQGGSPAPGSVVLYRDRRLGRDVLHRVVAVDAGRLVTKGDNNPYEDGYRPTAADVRGELWLRVPAVGGALQWAREPVHAALLVGLTVLLALAAGTGAGVAPLGRRALRPRRLSADPHALGTASLVALGVFVVLGAVAWARPVDRPLSETVGVQTGRFDYRASVPSGPVYPDGVAGTGEPVFVRLARSVDVRFRWAVDAPTDVAVGGTGSLDAVLSDGQGWERTVSLAPARRFDGSEAVLAGRLDLAALRRLTERVDRVTGAGVTTWSLTVQPRVAAEAGGRALAFAPQLRFRLDPVRLQVDPGDGGLEAALAPRAEERAERRVATVLPLGLSVGRARALALVGGLAALAAAAWAGAASRRREEESEPAGIAARHGAILLEAAAPATFAGRIVELQSFESLRRVAEHADRLVVHVRTDLCDEYTVEEGGTLYRYRAGARVEPDAWLRAAAAGR
jgi:signal peptidase I